MVTFRDFVGVDIAPVSKKTAVKTLTKGTFIHVASVFNRHLITLKKTPLVKTTLLKTTLLETALVKTALVKTLLVKTLLVKTPLVKTPIMKNTLVKTALVKKLTKRTFINVASVFNRHLITLVYAPLIDQAGGTSLTSSNTHIFVIL